jgi:carbon starvation protein
MNIAVLLIVTLLALSLGYRWYGRFIAKKVGIDPFHPTPAVTVNDGVDYVPTKPLVLFGHHYASIAAAGPIVGPTLALYYGIVPTWLWIVLGVIFLGAVHDFTVLFVSAREGGKSIAEIARTTLGKAGFLFFVGFALLLCILVTAAFLDLAARALTSEYTLEGLHLPLEQTLVRTEVKADGQHYAKLGGIASTSVIVITAFAPIVGYLLVRKTVAVVLMSLLAIGITLVSVIIGFEMPVTMDPKVWMVILSVYMAFAAWLPVWVVLQPRDFVNVHFLYIGLLGMMAGIIASGLSGVVVQAPAFNVTGNAFLALGMAWPFLFVTIACGACSGAHSLIASGTTAKQLASERHAPVIGYGAMLLEAVLGICVTLCIVGGLGFIEYEDIVWPQSDGKFLPGNAPLAFALAVGKTLFNGFGLATIYGTLFGILILEGFVITTIDTIVRLERYLFEELWATLFSNVPRFLRLKVVNSVLPVALMILLAFTNAYQTIWPIFGTANQLLAALSLIAVTAWFVQKGIRAWFTALPAIFMIITTVTSLLFLLNRYVSSQNWILTAADVLLILLSLGVVVMTFRYFYNLRAKLAVEVGGK